MKFIFLFLLLNCSISFGSEEKKISILEKRASRQLGISLECTNVIVSYERCKLGQQKVLALHRSGQLKKFAVKKIQISNYPNYNRDDQVWLRAEDSIDRMLDDLNFHYYLHNK